MNYILKDTTTNETTYFDGEDGKIHCPFPDHDDNDPSCFVTLIDGDPDKVGVFSCKGAACNRSGIMVTDQQEQNYQNRINQPKQEINPLELWGDSDIDFSCPPEGIDILEDIIVPIKEEKAPKVNPWDDADWDNKRVHIYTDEDGNNLKKLLIVKTKKEGNKLFSVKRWENNEWIKGLTNTDGTKVPIYPYKIQNLLKQEGKALLLLEGEKDVDNLHKIGIPNATTYGSANCPKMDERNLNYFRGKKVYIVVDNDASGFKFAKDMGGLLFAVAESVKICFLPGLKIRGDVSDYIEENNPTLIELKTVMVNNSYLYEECSERLSKYEDEFETLLSLNEALGKYKTFPIDCFPKKIRNYSTIQSEITNTYIEYHTLGLLTGLFGLLQGKFDLRVQGKWMAHASGVFVLVGDSGECKSHPVKAALAKIRDYDEAYDEDYARQELEFNLFTEEKRNKKGKRNTYVAQPGTCDWDNVAPTEPQMPKRRPYMTTKFTMEGLREVLRYNRKGIVAHMNEMDTLFGTMGAYKQGGKGDDASFFMNIIDGETASIDLARENIKIKEPRCSLIGTIQRKTIKGLYTEKTKDLGFAYRFMFAQPWEIKYFTMKMLSEQEQLSVDKADQKIEELYDIVRLYCVGLDHEINGDKEIVDWATPEVFQCFIDFNNNYVNGLRRSYSEVDDDIGGVLSKIVTYAPKIALGLQLLKFFGQETDTKDIEMSSMLDAIRIMRYFIYNNYFILHTTGDEHADKDLMFFLDYYKKYKVKSKALKVANIRKKGRVGYTTTKLIIDAVSRLVKEDSAEWIVQDKEFKLI